MYINKILSGKRLNLQNEKALQVQLKEIFATHSIPFAPEYRLDKNNIVDFMFHGGIAVEVKISTSYSKKNMYRQCERYMQFEEVTAIILITARSIGFPKEINGKPCYVINLGKAWL